MQYTEQQYDEFEKSMHERFPKMFAEPYGGFAIGPGWWPIVEKLCSCIQWHIDQTNERRELLLASNPYKIKVPDEVPQVVVGQIKEKFGGLRFYYNGGDERIRGMEVMAEALCSVTCETCGQPGQRRSGGWIRTLCDKHEEEHQQRIKELDHG